MPNTRKKVEPISSGGWEEVDKRDKEMGERYIRTLERYTDAFEKLVNAVSRIADTFSIVRSR